MTNNHEQQNGTHRIPNVTTTQRNGNGTMHVNNENANNGTTTNAATTNGEQR
jgi:hypothetical protein